MAGQAGAITIQGPRPPTGITHILTQVTGGTGHVPGLIPVPGGGTDLVPDLILVPGGTGLVPVTLTIVTPHREETGQHSALILLSCSWVCNLCSLIRSSRGSKASSRSRSRGRSRGRSRSRSKTPVNPYRVIDSIPMIAKDFSNVVKQTSISKFTDFCKDLQQRQEVENAGGPVQQVSVSGTLHFDLYLWGVPCIFLYRRLFNTGLPIS